MKKAQKNTLIIGVGLVSLSLFLHYLHYLVFQDLHHTLIFLFADIAFIPMEVFFTTFILDKLLEKREKEHIFEKLNIIIGVFFTELGTELLNKLSRYDKNSSQLHSEVLIKENWHKENFKALEVHVRKYNYSSDASKIDLLKLKDILDNNKDLLINLLTNPTLMEHEEFTEMLMALLHLKEELGSRCCKEVCNIRNDEVEHLNKDIAVAYKYLTFEWARYMKYLKWNYPSLFKKAILNNPFDSRTLEEKEVEYSNN